MQALRRVSPEIVVVRSSVVKEPTKEWHMLSRDLQRRFVVLGLRVQSRIRDLGLKLRASDFGLWLLHSGLADHWLRCPSRLFRRIYPAIEYPSTPNSISLYKP